MDAYIGTICVFGFNFAPYQWALCNGQILPIASNTALFSLLGTNYGGNGTTTFGLPNLQSSAAVCQGQLAGGSNYVMGETGGAESVTLLSSNLPAHVHQVSMVLKGNSNDNSSTSPSNAYPALSENGINIFNSSSNTNMKSPTVALANSGGGTPISINDPYLVMNYSIALYGYYPQRQ